MRGRYLDGNWLRRGLFRWRRRRLLCSFPSDHCCHLKGALLINYHAIHLCTRAAYSVVCGMLTKQAVNVPRAACRPVECQRCLLPHPAAGPAPRHLAPPLGQSPQAALGPASNTSTVMLLHSQLQSQLHGQHTAWSTYRTSPALICSAKVEANSSDVVLAHGVQFCGCEEACVCVTHSPVEHLPDCPELISIKCVGSVSIIDAALPQQTHMVKVNLPVHAAHARVIAGHHLIPQRAPCLALKAPRPCIKVVGVHHLPHLLQQAAAGGRVKGWIL